MEVLTVSSKETQSNDENLMNMLKGCEQRIDNMDVLLDDINKRLQHMHEIIEGVRQRHGINRSHGSRSGSET